MFLLSMADVLGLIEQVLVQRAYILVNASNADRKLAVIGSKYM